MTQPRPSPLLYLRAGGFWLVFGVLILAYSIPLSLARWIMPYAWRYPLARSWAMLSLHALRWICGIDWRVHGRDNIPSDEPVIFFAKHQSTWETMATAVLLPPLVWVVKRELLKLPFFGWGFAAVEPIAIDRSAGRAAIEQMVSQGRERLGRGRSVLIFPEGTRVHPGQAARYKMGGAVLAARTQYPVVPIALNAGEFWPRHSFVKWPGTVDVVIGEPIDPKGKSAEQINREAGNAIESMMADISGRGPAR